MIECRFGKGYALFVMPLGHPKAGQSVARSPFSTTPRLVTSLGIVGISRGLTQYERLSTNLDSLLNLDAAIFTNRPDVIGSDHITLFIQID